jgi:hypothetical protein
MTESNITPNFQMPPEPTKEKVIVVYLDNYDKIDSEFSWLYKTWLLHSLDEEFDLMVYYEPTAKHRLRKYPGIVQIPMPCIRMGDKYPFLKSCYMYDEGWCEPIRKYKYVFKTDCDVFLTSNLRGYTPGQILIGKGGYYNALDEKKVQHMKHLTEKVFNGHYRYCTNVGASYYGKTEWIVSTCQQVSMVTEILLRNNLFGPFDKGIASMLAGEIVINSTSSNQRFVLYALDYICWKTTSVTATDTLHIHAWHSKEPWSKHRFFEGVYSDWKIDSYEQALENAVNYCHWIATTPIEEIARIRERLARERS